MAAKIYLASDLHFEAWGKSDAIDLPPKAEIPVIVDDRHYDK